METASYSQFARMHGWSQPYISKLVKKGIIKKTSLLKERYRFKIIIERAERDLQRHKSKKRKPAKIKKVVEYAPVDPEIENLFQDLPSVNELLCDLPEIEI